MGFSKEEKSRRILRGVKTVFFLIAMLISFLVVSAPVFFAIADALLPSALLSASLSSSSSPPPPFFSLKTLSSHFNNYDFRYSLIDIPLISIIRSAVIICKYPKTKHYVSVSSLFVCFLFFDLFIGLMQVCIAFVMGQSFPGDRTLGSP
ncbi:hypothetical protein PTKIN_Ptkin16aG0541000 [Pterospermum kingtungense]